MRRSLLKEKAVLGPVQCGGISFLKMFKFFIANSHGCNAYKLKIVIKTKSLNAKVWMHCNRESLGAIVLSFHENAKSAG